MKLLAEVCISALVAGAMLGCGRAPVQETNSAPPNIEVIRPLHQEADRSITLPGDAVGFYECALHAKVTGYLQSIAVDKGDWVKKGQVLAVIEVPELKQNLERAKADFAIQKLTYQRLKHVREEDPKVVAQQDVDIAYSKMAQAQANLGVLDAMVSYTQIVAPFDGVITGRFADPGALIRAGGSDIGVTGNGAELSEGATEGAGGHMSGGPLLTMADIDRLRIYVYVPEEEAGFIRAGTHATVATRGADTQPIRANVVRYTNSLDLATRTMLTEIDLDNPQHKLYPRMYTTVTLDLVRHPDAIQLPAAAVEGVGAKQGYVFIVHDDALIKRPVSLGITDGRYVEITSGLSGNESIVATMSPALNQGERINPIRTSTADAGNSASELASER
ncbi:MAG TPA: efflux RND transporter periplasmic adaptor subunit [Candidatus Binataceae bacterium]|nr:efflux RND transporter periplasmic adaptor subunit [Candidatus Binataceae bacterium]